MEMTRFVKNSLIVLALVAGGAGVFWGLNRVDWPSVSGGFTHDAFTSETREKIFNAETFMLENGMQVVLIPNHRAPVVTHMVWYKAGAADEPPGKSGIAHFLEHLMFKGSKVIGGQDLPPGAFSTTVKALGGNDNAFTGQDYTAYFQSIAAEHLETVMRMEAGRMRGLKLTPETIDSERNVILEERRQRTDNNPRSKFNEQLNTIVHINHPYAVPVIGWMHEMENLTLEDAQTFYDQWYEPNNAVLIIAGDVTREQVEGLIREIYGSIPKAEIPVRERPNPPALNGSVKVEYKDQTVHQPVVQIIYRVPSYHQNHEDSLSLQILSDIMGSGSTSRIYKELVVNQKIAGSAGLFYSPAGLDHTTLTLHATPLPEYSIEDVEQALLEQIEILVKGGVTDQELSEAKIRMKNDAVYARDSLSGPAMIVGQGLTTGSSLDDIEYWPYNLDAITKENIQNVSNRYFRLTRETKPVRGYLLPESDSTHE